MKKIFTSILFLTLIAALGVVGQSRVLAPELTSPANGEKGLMPDVVLDWNAVSGSAGTVTYEIHLDTEGTFSDPQTFETEFVTGIQMSELSFGQIYFWRVRAHDDGNVSDWSETWSFAVINRPVILRPSETIEQKPDLTLEWRSVSGVEHYDYQIDTVYYWNLVEGLTSQDLNATVAFDDSATWMFGNGGLILYYNGDTVVEQTSGITDDLYTAFFLAADMGWAAGEGGVILSYNGTDWTEMTSNISSNILGMYFISADNGYAVGAGGKIVHYDGTGWSEMTSPVTRDLHAVAAADASNVWAVGKNGTIVYFDGTGWTTMTSNTTRDLYCIELTGMGTAWAAGRSGTIVFYDGTAWGVSSSGVTTKNINSMEFIDENTAWAAGDGGVLLSFDGFSWATASSTTTEDLKGISFSSPEKGWIVGEAGTVIAYDGDAFSSPLASLHPVSGSVTSAELVNLLFGTRYYWRLRARHGQDTSAWSAPMTFTILSSPTLEAPKDGNTNESLNLVFKWQAITDHIEYEIEVDDDPDFGSPITMTTEEKEIAAEMLRFGTLYHWRVKAIHANDVSDWSAVWQFETIGQVSLASPSNGATDIPLVPTLQWNAIGGADDYHVQLGLSDQFTDPIVDVMADAENASLTVPVVLTRNTTYYWRVRAVKGLDSTNFSQIWSFTTIPPVGIIEPGEGFEGLNVYPNPASESVTIQMDPKGSAPVNITISDLLGKEMLRESAVFSTAGNNHTINVGSLSKGIYLLRLDNGKSRVVRKLVIER